MQEIGKVKINSWEAKNNIEKWIQYAKTVRNAWKQKTLNKERKFKLEKITEAVERQLENLNSNQEKMLNSILEKRKPKITLDALMRHGTIIRNQEEIN